MEVDKMRIFVRYQKVLLPAMRNYCTMIISTNGVRYKSPNRVKARFMAMLKSAEKRNNKETERVAEHLVNQMEG